MFVERRSEVANEQTAEEVEAELAGLLGQYLGDDD